MDLLISHLLLYSLLVCLIVTSQSDGSNLHIVPPENLCAINNATRISKNLTNKRQHMLTLSSNETLIIRNLWNNTNGRSRHIECTFGIQTIHKHGMFVNVKGLKMRRHPSNNECIDYMTIEYSNGTKTNSICGEIGTNHKPMFSLIDPDGDMTIKIVLSWSSSGEPDQSLHLVATEYGDCTDELFQCRSDGEPKCISSSFVKDGIINCPGPACSDEDSCYDPVVIKVIDTSNIAISAITSFIFTMVGVGACLYACWKYRECFEECRRPVVAPPETVPPLNLELHPAPNAPTQQVAATVEDKDLPPSYESLFPER